MTNPYQPDDTHPGTNEWATQQSQQPQQQQYQQPYYQQPYQPQPPYQPQQQKSNTGLVVALSVLGTLVLLALAGAVAFLFVRSDGSNREQQDPVIVTEIETVAPESQNGQNNQGNKPNVNRREPMGSSTGFSNATAETGNTSSEFAGNVLAVFNERAAATGEFPGSLSVYSPVTGQTYTMSCWPAGGGARCQGGNNASVLLY